MKTRSAFLFIIFLFPLLTEAQTTVFQKSFGTVNEESANSVFQTFDGGYIVSGNTFGGGAGYLDAWLTKLDSNAGIVWSKAYGNTGLDYGNFAIQTADSGYLIAGGTIAPGAADEEIVITKTDANGYIIWTKQFGDIYNDEVSTLQAARQTTDGGYIITGIASGHGAAPDAQAFLLKLNSVGDTLWTKIYEGPGNDQAKCVLQTFDGGYIVCGRSNSFGNSNDVFLIKTDSAGNVQWSKAYGGTNWDEGMSVRQIADSGYIVAGGTTTYSIGFYDLMLMRMNANGNLLWTKGYGGVDNDAAYSMTLSHDGNVVITGFTESYNSGNLMGTDSADVILMKVDLNGDTLWVRDYGGITKDEAFGVSLTADHGFVVGAMSNSFTADSLNAYIIKTDSMGNCLCNTKVIDPVITTGSATETDFNWPVTSGFNLNIPAISATSLTLLSTTMCFGVLTEVQDYEMNDASITVSPNPFSEFTEISIDQPGALFQEVHYVLTDVAGKNVSSLCKLYPHQSGSRLSVRLEGNNLTPGIYFLELFTDNTTKEIFKTIKLVVIK